MMNCTSAGHEEIPAHWMVDLGFEEHPGLHPYCDECTDILVETRSGESVQTVEAYENMNALLKDALELAERRELRARQAAAAVLAEEVGKYLMPDAIQELADLVVFTYKDQRHRGV